MTLLKLVFLALGVFVTFLLGRYIWRAQREHPDTIDKQGTIGLITFLTLLAAALITWQGWPLVEFFQGKRFFDINCLCFLKTEETLIKEAEEDIKREIGLKSPNLIPLNLKVRSVVKSVDVKNQRVTLWPEIMIGGEAEYVDVEWTVDEVRERMVRLFRKYPGLNELVVEIKGPVWDQYRRERIDRIATLHLTWGLAFGVRWENFLMKERIELLEREKALIWWIRRP